MEHKLYFFWAQVWSSSDLRVLDRPPTPTLINPPALLLLYFVAYYERLAREIATAQRLISHELNFLDGDPPPPFFFAGSIPPSLGNLAQLTELNLSGNSLGGE